ncbi:hypothetical protein BDK51DRAFT_43501 [Blyttiomyces helicus]|uniref:Uncharacterized protein n=1 Tax=Blyttiomyces helicus TaxID=388810 RepID=A0A4P9W669_9FUNG|nr:hypothetical protein BDK51DRAFT_43501 [Blyttiomyces helicus]|eukprot:RKO86853.1 hypothetical protein BDK51DRAFT_43501 [Blyttiomyces helicus]
MSKVDATSDTDLAIECQRFSSVFRAIAARYAPVHTADGELLVREGDPFAVHIHPADTHLMSQPSTAASAASSDQLDTTGSNLNSLSAPLDRGGSAATSPKSRAKGIPAGLLDILENQRVERGGRIAFTKAAYNAGKAKVAESDQRIWHVWVSADVKAKFQRLQSECAVGAPHHEFAEMLLDLAGLQIGGHSPGINYDLVGGAPGKFTLHMLGLLITSCLFLPNVDPYSRYRIPSMTTGQLLRWIDSPHPANRLSETRGSATSSLHRPSSSSLVFPTTAPQFQGQALSAEAGEFMSYGMDPVDLATGQLSIDDLFAFQPDPSFVA